jgi:hypothetical protein
LKSELEAERPDSQTPVGSDPGPKKVADEMVTFPSDPKGNNDLANGRAKERVRLIRYKPQKGRCSQPKFTWSGTTDLNAEGP